MDYADSNGRTDVEYRGVSDEAIRRQVDRDVLVRGNVGNYLRVLEVCLIQSTETALLHPFNEAGLLQGVLECVPPQCLRLFLLNVSMNASKWPTRALRRRQINYGL